MQSPVLITEYNISHSFIIRIHSLRGGEEGGREGRREGGREGGRKGGREEEGMVGGREGGKSKLQAMQFVAY